MQPRLAPLYVGLQGCWGKYPQVNAVSLLVKKNYHINWSIARKLIRIHTEFIGSHLAYSWFPLLCQLKTTTRILCGFSFSCKHWISKLNGKAIALIDITNKILKGILVVVFSRYIKGNRPFIVVKFISLDTTLHKANASDSRQALL